MAIGESEVCINITINPDDIYELSETFSVCIGSDDPAVVAVLVKSLVDIIDNTSKQKCVFAGSRKSSKLFSAQSYSLHYALWEAAIVVSVVSGEPFVGIATSSTGKSVAPGVHNGSVQLPMHVVQLKCVWVIFT